MDKHIRLDLMPESCHGNNIAEASGRHRPRQPVVAMTAVEICCREGA